MSNEIREQIAKLAYEFYVKSGHAAGRDLQNWLAAEKAVLLNREAGGRLSPVSRRRVATSRKKK